MLAILAFVFICVRASSALVRTSAFLQPVVRGQVYIFEISPPLVIGKNFFLLLVNGKLYWIHIWCERYIVN